MKRAFLLLFALLLLPVGDAEARRTPTSPENTRDLVGRDWNADQWVEEGKRQKAEGNWISVVNCYRAALGLGYDPQSAWLEIAYAYKQLGEDGLAAAAFREAARGPDESKASRARAEIDRLPEAARSAKSGPGVDALEAAYRLKNGGFSLLSKAERLEKEGKESEAAAARAEAEDLLGQALEGLDQAQAKGVSATLVTLEKAYIALRRGQKARAMDLFDEAGEGEGVYAARARKEVAALRTAASTPAAGTGVPYGPGDRELEVAWNLKGRAARLYKDAASMENPKDPKKAAFERRAQAREGMIDAIDAFGVARKAGAGARTVNLEIGYSELAIADGARADLLWHRAQGDADGVKDAEYQMREATRRAGKALQAAKNLGAKDDGRLSLQLAYIALSLDQSSSAEGWLKSAQRLARQAAATAATEKDKAKHEETEELATSQLAVLPGPDLGQAVELPLDERYYRRAVVYRDTGRLRRAYDDFDAARLEGYEPVEIDYQLGLIDLQMLRTPGASWDLDSLPELPLDPGTPPAAEDVGGRDTAVTAPPPPTEADLEKQKQIDALLEQAYDAKAAGDLTEAATKFVEAIGAGADEQHTQLELAFIAIAQDRRDDARTHLKIATRGPDPARAALAQSQLDNVAPQDPDRWNARHWQDAASRFGAVGNHEEAADAFRRSLGLSGGDPQLAHLGLADLALVRDADVVIDEATSMQAHGAGEAPTPVDSEPAEGAAPTAKAPEPARELTEAEARRALRAHHLAEAADGPNERHALAARRALATQKPLPLDEWTADHHLALGAVLLELGDLSSARDALADAREASSGESDLSGARVFEEELERIELWMPEVRAHLGSVKEACAADFGRPIPEICDSTAEKLATLPPQSREEWKGAHWLRLGRAYSALGAYERADEALLKARDTGADPQVVSMDLGYVAMARGDTKAARAHFKAAGEGSDLELAERAKLQARYLPRIGWFDVYGEILGLRRVLPDASADWRDHSNAIFFARARVGIDPLPHLSLYGFLHFGKDIASLGQVSTLAPSIKADNVLLLGAGAMVRLWEERVGIYARIGPGFKLINDARPSALAYTPVVIEGRIGAFLGVEAPSCRPIPQMGSAGARIEARKSAFCGEVYAETIYVHRFHAGAEDQTLRDVTEYDKWNPIHNTFWNVRGRVGFTYLVTGPVAWQPVLEGRFLRDFRQRWYNNVADMGVAHRWRLLEPIGIDLMVGLHAGSYLQNRESIGVFDDALECADCLPARLPLTRDQVERREADYLLTGLPRVPWGFVDFRVLAATYVRF